MLLSLPTFAPEVPFVIEFTPASERHLRLVLAMSRLGMIQDADLDDLQRTGMSSNAIRCLVEKGWQRQVGQEFNFQTISAFATLILPDPSDEQRFTSKEGKPLVGVALSAGQPEWIAIGAFFTAVESLHSGLGMKALSVLDSLLTRFGQAHTPSGVLDICRGLHWYGEDDEAVVLEELGDEADEADIPRRDAVFHGVPEWAYDPFAANLPPVISNAEFAVLATQYAEHAVGKGLFALAQLADLMANDKGFPQLSDDEVCPYEPPIVCGWDSPTDFEAIFDDNYRWFCEAGEEAPWVGAIFFEPNETAISNALIAVCHTGQVLSALDMALTQIKEFQP